MDEPCSLVNSWLIENGYIQTSKTFQQEYGRTKIAPVFGTSFTQILKHFYLFQEMLKITYGENINKELAKKSLAMSQAKRTVTLISNNKAHCINKLDSSELAGSTTQINNTDNEHNVYILTEAGLYEQNPNGSLNTFQIDNESNQSQDKNRYIISKTFSEENNSLMASDCSLEVQGFNGIKSHFTKTNTSSIPKTATNSMSHVKIIKKEANITSTSVRDAKTKLDLQSLGFTGSKKLEHASMVKNEKLDSLDIFTNSSGNCDTGSNLQNAKSQKDSFNSNNIEGVCSNLNIRNAITALRSGRLSLAQASKKFEIPKKRLKDYAKGQYIFQRRILTPEEELCLVDHVRDMDRKGTPITLEEIKKHALEISLKNSRSVQFKGTGPSPKWWHRFKLRHEVALDGINWIGKVKKRTHSL